MSCNCKARKNFNEIVNNFERRNDKVKKDEKFSFRKLFQTICDGFLKLLSGIIFFIIFIAVSIPIIIYSSICIIIGKEIKIKLPKILSKTLNEQQIV